MPAEDVALLGPASRFAENAAVTNFIIYNAAQGTCSCEPCNYVAFDLRSMAAHANRRHGITALASLYAGLAGECQICMRKYPNRIRLVNHLKSSSTCMLNHEVYRLLPSVEERQEAMEAGRLSARTNKDGGRAVSFSRGRTLPMSGPIRPLYIPSDRSMKSTNPSFKAALMSGYKMPMSINTSIGGITWLIA